MEVEGGLFSGDTLLDGFDGRVDTVGQEHLEMLASGDLSAALRRIPGVTVSRYNPVGAYGGSDGGAIFIRGHGGGRPGADISVLVDGAPRFVSVWSHPLLDLVSTDAAASIEVFKSPQPVRLGNMAFGAVNIVTKSAGEESGARAHVAYGSNNTVVLQGEGGVSEGPWRVYALDSHRYSAGHRENADGRVDLLMAKAQFVPEDSPWQLSYLVQHTDSRADDPGRTDESVPAELEGIIPRYEAISTFHLLDGRASLDAGSLSIKLYREDGDADWLQQHIPPPAPFPAQQLSTITEFSNMGARLRAETGLEGPLNLAVGLDHDRYGGSVREDYAMGDAADTWFPEETFVNSAGYLEVAGAGRASKRLRRRAGLRYNSPRHFDPAIGWQGGLRWQSGDVSFYANHAHAFNYPGLFVTVFGRRGPPWNVGETWKDFDPQIVDHYELGGALVLPRAWQADLSVYRDDVRDDLRIVAPGPGSSGRLALLPDYTLRGSELMLRGPLWKGARLHLGGSWMEADDADVPNLPEWTGSAALLVQLTKEWELEIDSEYSSSRLVLNPRFAEAAETVDGYLLMGARLSWSRDVTGLGTVLCYLRVENLTDQDYAFRPGYPMPGITWLLGTELEW
jgi:iron complex outermembrane receptor protein